MTWPNKALKSRMAMDIGRLLITLMLCEAVLLKEPTLYLSLYLKAYRATYYRLLNETREEGYWKAWLEFFLTGIIQTANKAVTTSVKLLQQIEADTLKVATLGRAAENTARVHT